MKTKNPNKRQQIKTTEERIKVIQGKIQKSPEDHLDLQRLMRKAAILRGTAKSL